MRRADLEAAQAIKGAADKILEAANLITNCMNEFRPELKALANRNYREIQMSSNAIRQLVSMFFSKTKFFQKETYLSIKFPSSDCGGFETWGPHSNTEAVVPRSKSNSSNP